MDLRVIDTRTGEVLHSHRAEGKAWGKAAGFKMKSGLIDFGGEIFHKTPLGKATRRTIGSAVEFILRVAEKRTEDFSWLGRVIDTEGAQLYLDAGRIKNVQVGDELKIFDVEKVLQDPETNAILGLVEREVGIARVVSSEPKYAKAVAISDFLPKKGCLVRFVSEEKGRLPRRISQAGYRVME